MQPDGGARSAVLLDALAGVPANMAPVIARFLGELDAGAAASVSKKKSQGGMFRSDARSKAKYPCAILPMWQVVKRAALISFSPRLVHKTAVGPTTANWQ